MNESEVKTKIDLLHIRTQLSQIIEIDLLFCRDPDHTLSISTEINSRKIIKINLIMLN